MIKGKRELNSSILASKNKKAKGGNSNLKNDNSLIMKKKKKCIATSQSQKTDLKGKVTAKHTEDQQTSKNFNVFPEHNKEFYECQLERINLILKESSHCPTLTQEELRILFMKYKLDGNFEANKNLPSFTAFNNVNQNQPNFKHNAYKCQENSNRINDIEVDNFQSYSANVENILPAPHNTFPCENNNFPYNAQYEHFENISESSQQYNKIHAMQYFDQPWNSNIYNNFHGEAWNNDMSLTNRNENYQLWRSENSECIPESNNFQCQYGVKNYCEQPVWNMHSPNTNLYPLMNNENLRQPATTASNYNNHMHQDIDINNSASSVALNNFLPDSTSFLSSFTNVNNQYI